MNIRAPLPPLVELHSHLEGTLEPATLLELARRGCRENMLPTLNEQRLGEAVRSTTLAEFRASFDLNRPFRTTAADMAFATDAELSRCVERGVVYAEYRYNFDGPLTRGHDPWEVMEAILGEMRRYEKCHGLITRLIFGIKRDLDRKRLAEMIELACEAHRLGLVVGLDLNGDEAGSPLDPVVDLFEPARRSRVPMTLHAGEWDGPRSVWSALECGANRIGHGVRAVEDPTLVKELALRGTCLEVSATSNVCTGVYPSLAAHPARTLFEAGVRVTINSDDPAIFGSPVDAEYRLWREHFGFDDDMLNAVSSYALDAAFLDTLTRQALATRHGLAAHPAR